VDWAKYNIRVNAIAPMIYTPVVDRAQPALPQSERASCEKAIGQAQGLPDGMRGAGALGRQWRYQQQAT